MSLKLNELLDACSNASATPGIKPGYIHKLALAMSAAFYNGKRRKYIPFGRRDTDKDRAAFIEFVQDNGVCVDGIFKSGVTLSW